MRSWLGVADADFGEQPRDDTDYRQVFAGFALPLGVFSVSGRTIRFVEINAAFGALLSVNRNDAPGRRIDDILDDDLARLLGEDIEQSVETGVVGRFEHRIRKGANNARCEFVIHPLHGAVAKAVVMARPLGVPLRGRELSWRLFDALGPLSRDAVYTVDLAKRRGVQASDRLFATLGYRVRAPRFISTRLIEQALHPDDRREWREQLSRYPGLRDGEVAVFRGRMRHADGGWRWIESRGRVHVRTRLGDVRRVICVVSDTSEHHALTDALSRMSAELIGSEEAERRRIARELHDSTSQHLVAVGLSLSRLERAFKNGAPQEEIWRDIRSALGVAHQEIRAFSYSLHPPTNGQGDLTERLRAFAKGFGDRAGLAVEVSTVGRVAPLTGLIEHALFRVAQEALMNVHRHAAAHNVSIRLLFGPETVSLEVLDDGRGLRDHSAVDETSPACGVGVSSMRARMALIGGALSIQSSLHGVLVRAEAPLGVSKAKPG